MQIFSEQLFSCKWVQQCSHRLFCGLVAAICISRCLDRISLEVSLHSFTCSYKSQVCLRIHLANPHVLNTSAFTKENAFLMFTLLIIKCLVLSRQKDSLSAGHSPLEWGDSVIRGQTKNLHILYFIGSFQSFEVGSIMIPNLWMRNLRTMGLNQ